ncbi:MAG: hypothetical protein AAB649_04590, partial [Patescibacteria group bacterium]
MKNNTILWILGIVVVLAGFLSYQTRQQSSSFSTTTAGLPAAKSSETVELKNGDTFNLTASIVQKTIQGKPVKMLAYNGMVPGPLMKVSQNSQITVHFT